MYNVYEDKKKNNRLIKYFIQNKQYILVNECKYGCQFQLVPDYNCGLDGKDYKPIIKCCDLYENRFSSMYPPI